MRVDLYQGVDVAGLEEKIKQYTENDPGNNEDSDIPKGYVCSQNFSVNRFTAGNVTSMCFIMLYKLFI